MDPSRVFRHLGRLLLFLAMFLATALPWAWVDGGGPAVQPWLASIAVMATAAAVLALLGRRLRRPRRSSRWQIVPGDSGADELSRRDALAIVVLAWVLASVLGGLPFLLTGTVETPVDALFEAVSGLNTTGSTVLTDIEGRSRAALWWRALLQWLGGMGIIVLFLAVFPEAQGGGRKLLQSEVPGPETDKLRPRTMATTRVLWSIYGTLTGAAFVAFAWAGMTPHEAACHAFSTLATGGFSTRDASIGGFGSPLIEALTTVFMLLAGCNFALFYAATRGQGRQALRDAELKRYVLLVVAAWVLVAGVLVGGGTDVPAAAGRAAFQVASLATSTGFGTADFTLWPPAATAVLLGLMIVGGMGGSTAGGFKVGRTMIVVSTARQEIKRQLHPRMVTATRIGRRVVPERVVRSSMALLALLAVVLMTATLALALLGLDLEVAFSGALTAVSNSGPGLGPIGPAGNFAALPATAKLVLAGLMLLGRLEYLAVLALFSGAFRRSRRGG